MKYIKSKYIKIIDTGMGEKIFFNPLNMNILKGDHEDENYLNSYNEYKEGDFNSYNFQLFHNSGFIVSEKQNELHNFIEIRNNLIQNLKNKKSKICYARISLTGTCNMACKYCFVKNEINISDNMSEDLFLKIIKWLISENPEGVLIIQYFGGEPLLNMRLIQLGNNILKEAKNKGLINDYVQEIVTNGTLLDESKCKFFVEEKIKISVSLDGYKDLNDKNRIYENGKGTYEDAVKGLLKFVEAGGKASIIITTNKDNIYCFKETIEYFYDHLKISEVTVNSPHPINDRWEVDGALFADALKELILFCIEKNITFHTLANNLIYNIKNKNIQVGGCINLPYKRINGWGAYFSSTGKISKCLIQCNDLCSSNFENFEIDEKFKEWHYGREIDDKCINCIGIALCGGPCSIEYGVSKNNIDRCKFMKTMIPWILGRL